MKDNPKVSSATSATLDPEDQEALARANGDHGGDSAIQGAASPLPGAGDSQGPPAPTQQARTIAGHIATLANEFFTRRFGPDHGLSPALREAITLDTATALDTYLPNIEAKPGIFSAFILVSHYLECRRAATIETRSASSDKAGPEKPLSSNGSSPENGGS